MPYNYYYLWIIFSAKAHQTYSDDVETIDDAINTEEAGDANIFNNNDLPHEDASHQFIR